MRHITKGTRVSFRSTVDGNVKRVLGTVNTKMSILEARRRGLVKPINPDAKSPRKSGTILEILTELGPGHSKLLYKHQSLVKVVKEPNKEEEEVKLDTD